MPIQNYNIYTGDAYKGQISDASTPRVIGTLVASVATLFGVALASDASLGHDTGNVFGVAVREANHEAKFRPSTGETEYPAGQSISVMREGYINLEVTGNPAVEGALANVNDTTGEFTGGAADAGETASTNVRWMESGVVGAVVRARIDIK